MPLLAPTEEEEHDRLRVAMDEFDPNAERDAVWGVYKPNTRPHWRVYRSRGNALSCLGWGWPGVIYKKNDGGVWEEIARVDPSHRNYDTNCESCGDKLVSPYWYGRKFIWIGKPNLRLLVVCFNCNERLTKSRIDDRYV